MNSLTLVISKQLGNKKYGYEGSECMSFISKISIKVPKRYLLKIITYSENNRVKKLGTLEK